MDNISTDHDFDCFINVSSDSLTRVPWIVRHPDDLDFDTIGNGLAVAVILTLLFLVGVPWNIFVICAIIKKKLYTQPILMLMLNLAVTNLLLCVLIMPLNIVSGIAGEYIFGESDLVRCRVCQTGVMAIILPWISIHTLCLMSIDRFIYLKRPLEYVQIVTPKRMFATIVTVWIFCTLIALPPLFGFGEIKFSYTVATCVPLVVERTHIAPNLFYALLLLLDISIPIIALFIMYILIMCIVRRSFIWRKQRSTLVEKGATRKQHSNSQLRMVRLFSTIFIANLVTWLPMIVLVLTGAILGAKRIPTLVFSIAYLSYLAETVIHPILQACLIQEIRLIISVMLECVRSKLSKLFEFVWKKWRSEEVLVADFAGGLSVVLPRSSFKA